MDLRSHYPYWPLRHGIVNTYPSLHDNIKTDVAIVGGGISGALVAWHLAKTGLSVALFDRRHIGTGSTAASTSLLQYEIDTPLYELIKLVGEKNAVASYQLCSKAIDDLQKICKVLSDKDLFITKPSFQFASLKKDVKSLELEFSLRAKLGFQVNWLDENSIVSKFGFSKSGGILSNQGAEVNSYLITHRLLEQSISHGTRVYDNTEIKDISYGKRRVDLVTGENFKISAKNLVIACGYESQRYLPMQVQKLHSTYAIISEPQKNDKFWYKNSLIWETADPYIYLRTTDDKRIIIGGKDEDFSNPKRRDSLLSAKAISLRNAFQTLFPHIPFKIDFKWAGTFGSTKDGLPYIGTVSNRPHTYFALGLGGNGVTFSVIAAQMIRDSLVGKKNKSMNIFSFTR